MGGGGGGGARDGGSAAAGRGYAGRAGPVQLGGREEGPAPRELHRGEREGPRRPLAEPEGPRLVDPTQCRGGGGDTIAEARAEADAVRAREEALMDEALGLRPRSEATGANAQGLPPQKEGRPPPPATEDPADTGGRARLEGSLSPEHRRHRRHRRRKRSGRERGRGEDRGRSPRRDRERSPGREKHRERSPGREKHRGRQRERSPRKGDWR